MASKAGVSKIEDITITSNSLISMETIDAIRASWINHDIQECPIRRSWREIFAKVFEKKEVKEQIAKFIAEEKSNMIFPSKYKIFNCFNAFSFEKLKVIIIGQDPYHSLPNQAQGFCFLVPKDMNRFCAESAKSSGIKDSVLSAQNPMPYPPSLLNIIKEVRSDVGVECDNLESWISQGVLLMNASLTVRKGEAGSHIKYWEPLTNELIREISSRKKGLIFMLWGKFAQSKKEFINMFKGHNILEASHPSPLAGGKGWFGSGHFSKANDILVQNNQDPIVWGQKND